MKSDLLTTEDGSHTLYVPEIDESYHSTHGAIQESMHVFIENGLKKCAKKEISILEIGFGTGLNAFLTMDTAAKLDLKIQYFTVEKFPVDMEQVLLLNYPDQIWAAKKSLFLLMHFWKCNQPVGLLPNFEFVKYLADFTEFNHSTKYDLVYFDAFSPEKQPEMWTAELFGKIYAHCNAGAILTTYCAKGNVRRALQNVGFKVERIPGPPGKREMLRATK